MAKENTFTDQMGKKLPLLIIIVSAVALLGIGDSLLRAQYFSNQRTGLTGVLLSIHSADGRRVADDIARLLGGKIVSPNTSGHSFELRFYRSDEYKDIPTIEAILGQYPQFRQVYVSPANPETNVHSDPIED